MIEMGVLELALRNKEGQPLTEQEIAESTPPSAGPWEDVFRTARIPENVSGLRILDIGGGASDATSKLLHLGADAYSIDPSYAKMAFLKEMIQRQNSIFVGEELKLSKRVLRNFKQSANVNKDRYKPALATEIQFPDEYFDIVFSRFTIFGYLDVEAGVMNEAVVEALRVTKRGGVVKFSRLGDSKPTTLMQ